MDFQKRPSLRSLSAKEVHALALNFLFIFVKVGGLKNNLFASCSFHQRITSHMFNFRQRDGSLFIVE